MLLFPGLTERSLNLIGIGSDHVGLGPMQAGFLKGRNDSADGKELLLEFDACAPEANPG